jgi:hypothetical protein
MMIARALAPPQRSSPPTSGAAPPGAPPGAPPFQSALEEHWARTAAAEGHKQNHSPDASEAPAGATALAAAALPMAVAVAGAPAAAAAPTPAASTGPTSKGTPAASYAPASSLASGTAAALSVAVGASAPPVPASAEGQTAADPLTQPATPTAPTVAPAPAIPTANPAAPDRVTIATDATSTTPIPATSIMPSAGAAVSALSQDLGSQAGASTTTPALPTPPKAPELHISREPTPSTAPEVHVSREPGLTPGLQEHPTDAQPSRANTPPSTPGTTPANDATSATSTTASQAARAPLDGSPQTPAIQPAATATTTHTRPVSPPAAASSSERAPSVSPAANQAPAPAAAPTAEPTTGEGTATTRTEPGEAASSPNTSVAYTIAAAPAQTDALPAKAAFTRGSGARPGALAATQLTNTNDSTPASTTDAAGQPLAASPVGEQASPATASAAAPSFSSGAGMQDMIDSISATIEVAARQGLTQARIALHPAELGEIRIHLTQTADGLLARVTADTPAVAQVLVGCRAELHHSLGVSLLRLDIGSSGQPDVGGGEGRFPGRSDSSAASSSTRPEENESGSEPVPGLEGVQPTPGPARGELVDVLA